MFMLRKKEDKRKENLKKALILGGLVGAVGTAVTVAIVAGKKCKSKGCQGACNCEHEGCCCEDTEQFEAIEEVEEVERQQEEDLQEVLEENNEEQQEEVVVGALEDEADQVVEA